jgi:hypothetical protein
VKRPPIGAIVTVAVVVLAVIGGVIVWRQHTVNSKQASLTLDQAGPVAERYAADAAAHAPGPPKLDGPARTSVPCDDPADRAPKGSADLALDYKLTFDQPQDPVLVFDQLKAYWTSKGYKVMNEDPATLATRSLTVENPADGFRLTLSRGAPGNLSIAVSSPCLKSGSGTPSS